MKRGFAKRQVRANHFAGYFLWESRPPSGRPLGIGSRRVARKIFIQLGIASGRVSVVCFSAGIRNIVVKMSHACRLGVCCRLELPKWEYSNYRDWRSMCLCLGLQARVWAGRREGGWWLFTVRADRRDVTHCAHYPAGRTTVNQDAVLQNACEADDCVRAGKGRPVVRCEQCLQSRPDSRTRLMT